MHGYSTGEISLYYEWYEPAAGERPPVLLIHGGGSTIDSNWGRLIPALAPSRPVWAVELQGHGRTAAGKRPPSFEASADDVAHVLDDIALGAVDLVGFSNGGQVAMQLASRRPELVRRLIVASAPYRRDGMIDGFWEGLQGAGFEDMPAVYRDADLRVSGDPGMHDGCSSSTGNSCSRSPIGPMPFLRRSVHRRLSCPLTAM
jgi:pimeloyl-ACP methyl ester carboxylesterase